jgi:photosystem II stability/assembly factor-like uncharacterized protein
MIRRPSRSPWLLLAGLALASRLPALAATDRWTSLGPDLSSVSALAASPAGVVYAGTLLHGVFQSADAGSRWSAPAVTGYFPVRELAIDPGDPRRAYALSYQGGLYRSGNGGGWTFVGPGSPVSSSDAFAVAPGDPRRLYVFATHDLEVSRDRGATWESETTNLDAPVRILRVDPRHPDVLYAGNSQGLMKSVDGGRTWRAGGGLGGTLGPVRSLALDPRHPDVQYAGTVGQGIPTQGVWKSADAGATWKRVLPIAGTDQVVALAVDPADSRRIYAAVDRFATEVTPPTGEIWRSTDAGASWSRALAHSRPILSLAVDPGDPRRVYAGFEIDGVLASGDRGATWRPARRGLRAASVSGIAVDPHHPGGLWVAAPENSSFRGINSALFHSVDGGRSWAAAEQGLRPGFPPQRIVLDPVRPERLFAFAPRIVYRSLDGGASWQEVLPLADATVEFLAIDPSGRDRIYAAGFEEVFQEEGTSHFPILLESVDGGETWTDLTPGFETGRPGGLVVGSVNGLAIQPDRPDTLFAGVTEGLFKSRDGGHRWVRLGAPADCQGAGGIVIDPLVTSTQYAFDFDFTHPVAKSTDRGAHWQCTALGQTSVESLLADPHRSGTLYAWGFDGIFVTDDGGATWRPFAAGLPAGQVLSLAADPHVPGRIYAGLPFVGLYTLTRSASGE